MAGWKSQELGREEEEGVKCAPGFFLDLVLCFTLTSTTLATLTSEPLEVTKIRRVHFNKVLIETVAEKDDLFVQYKLVEGKYNFSAQI